MARVHIEVHNRAVALVAAGDKGDHYHTLSPADALALAEDMKRAARSLIGEAPTDRPAADPQLLALVDDLRDRLSADQVAPIVVAWLAHRG